MADRSLPTREHGSLEACCPGQFGAPTPEAGVTFVAQKNLTLIDLRGNPRNPAFLASAQATLGLELPLQPNTLASTADCSALWLGPDEWLLVSRRHDHISERLAIADGWLTDVSHGRSAWRISGPHTLDVLAKGISVDLHIRAFAPGSCVQTGYAHVGVIVHRLDATTFDVYCARSYAQYLWHALTHAACEYGYEVLAAAE